jgi:hypothetical protein
VHKLRPPTAKQIEYAASLGITTEGKSFRVIAAEIQDTLETTAFETAAKMKLRPGMVVDYIGPRDDMPKRLTISSVARNGFIYFRATTKYCRPWYLKRVTRGSNAV